MAKKTKEEALETRNLLLDTAECVFNEKGAQEPFTEWMNSKWFSSSSQLEN